HLVPALILYHPSEEVVIHALALFTRARRKNVAHVVDRLLEHASARVRSAAIATRAVVAPDARLLNLRLSLEEAPEVRATIVLHLIATGELVGAEADERLEDLLRRGSSATKIALAQAIASHEAKGFVPALVTLASSVEPEVRLATAQAIARHRSPELV